MQMKTLQPTIAVLFALGLMASTANATVIVDDPDSMNNPPGACGIPCNFNFGTNDFSDVSIPAITDTSIGDINDRVIKNFGTLESAVFEGTISNLATFSLFETITNNSVFTPPAAGGGGEWDKFTVGIEFFGVDFANGDSINWALVSTNTTGVSVISPVSTGLGTSDPSFEFGYNFDSPLGFMESFSLQISFNTDIDTDVNFRITQTPTAVTTSTPMPEPTTLALLGLGLAGLGASRRKKA